MRFGVKRIFIVLFMLLYISSAHSQIDDRFLAVGFGGVIELRNPLTGERGQRIEVPSGHSITISDQNANQSGVSVNIPDALSPSLLSHVCTDDSWSLLAGFNQHQWNIYSDAQAVYYSTPTHGRQSAYALVKHALKRQNDAYDDYKIICGSTGGGIGIFNAQNGVKEKILTQSIFSPGSLGITCFGMYQQDDDYFLVCGSHCGGCIDIYNYHTGLQVKSLLVLNERCFISGLVIFKKNDEVRIIATTTTGTVTCWSKTNSWRNEWNSDVYHHNEQKRVPINGLILYKDARSALKCIPITSDGVIRIMDACTGIESKVFTNEAFATSSLLDAKPWNLSLADIKPYRIGDSIKLAVTYKKNQREGFLAIWDLQTGLELHKKIPPAALTLFEDNGKTYCVTGGIDGIVRTWDLTEQQLVILFGVQPKNSTIKIDTICLATRKGAIVDPKAFTISHSYVGTCGSDMPFFDLANLEMISV